MTNTATVTSPKEQSKAVPLLDLKAQYATIREETRAAMDRVAESQYFILGPEVKALEEEVAAYYAWTIAFCLRAPCRWLLSHRADAYWGGRFYSNDCSCVDPEKA